MSKNFFIYLAAMAGVTYLIRMVPFTLVRGKIKSVYIQSFLYYVPYAVLGAMTFPYIFYSTGSLLTGVLGSAVAFLLSFRRCSLLTVAGVSALVAFVTGLF
ncbi:MAG: AzlD domain-containing protein [Clostridia bacterium]|nr:AzlD domain-containing protein [Clostridia bacterium]